MSFAVIADLPLGTYYGHVGDGDIDPLPSPARLHAALLCAAAAGPRAVVDGDEMRPCAADAGALRWLEDNPPDGIQLPPTAINHTPGTAYRDDGLLLRRKAALTIKKPGKPARESVAVAGPFAWVWASDPPDEVSAALTELCADVSHLGMAETPVRLRVGATVAMHVAEPEADFFGGVGLDVPHAAPGRTRALATAHTAARGKPPSVSQDSMKSDEKSLPPPVVIEGLATGRYVPRLRPVAQPVPWTHAVLAPLDRLITPTQRVRWAVAVHRALIAQIGDGAPALVTGQFADGVPRPANRVAIHFLEGSWAFAGATGAPSTLAVLVPAGAQAGDLDAIGAAMGRLQIIRGPGGKPVRVDKRLSVVAADEFWPAPVPGLQRRWLTVPAAVPEMRPPRRGSWSMADTVAVAVGMVWRDVLLVEGRGDHRCRALAAAATDHGVVTDAVSRLHSGDAHRFVHKVQPGTLVQPYEALLCLGRLAGDRTLAAIGQSRHLGGGLLVPVDQPVDQRDTQAGGGS
jgi:CRISPR-associated protein Csb2